MKTTRLLVLVLPLASLPFSGCSWLFVQPLPANYERGDTITCTTNRAAPVIDTLFTLTNVGSAVYVSSENNVTNKGTAVTAGLLVGALWLSSAIYGYSKTSECQEAVDDDAPAPHYRRPIVRRRAPPPSYAPPAAPPAESPAPSVTVEPPAAPPTAPASAPAQQQDDDEPGAAPQPPKRPPALPPKPDAPRFGG